MKKQFGNLFYIVPIENVKSVSGNNIVLKPDEKMDLILSENNIELTEVLTQSGANDYFKQSSSVVTHGIADKLINKYRISKVVMQFKSTTGELYTIGDNEVPVRVRINRSVQVDQWQIICNSPHSAFN